MICERERQQLLTPLYRLGFALDDARLYLDTHPQDMEALSWYRKMQKAYEEARQGYICKCGPLTAEDDSSEDYWEWIQDPWPWEGGDC